MKQFCKTFMLLIVSFLFLTLCSCEQKETLYFLNWGEYINDELVTKFEEEYNCNVVVDIAESNELFYAKVKSGTTAYDLTCPSEYMVEKMYVKGLISEIDFSKIENYNRSNFLTPVNNVLDSMDEVYPGISSYACPYFWGSFGLSYNKKCEGLEELLQTYGWDAYFNNDITKNITGLRKAMYSVPRFSYAACMFYNNKSPNEYNDENLKLFKETLTNGSFSQWGTDSLKKGIESGNTDLSFNYTGDCLDMIYVKIEDGVALEDMTFDIYIPENTILHMDSLVIPKKARHVDLAYKFINFMLDPENAYLNAGVVGYCTPLTESYNMIVNKVGITEGISEEDRFWYENWGNTVAKYYPMDENGIVQVSGTPLTYFDIDQLSALENIVNTVKVNKQ